ncbi:cyanophycin synthetase [Fictibacillus sp. 18YEL24]|uniref:cyanophycin synthetase n=1 Tax=Fictibacillus sp. 18YEL24 TaxID=2745875 RepID=UPI0018CD5B40|nr:cyanophycin synthetase [Fictibacillus sp. 18YEL24]MBH0170266.1 cyanophycin synthetase [Fictibacillus sp. 18YEL24]
MKINRVNYLTGPNLYSFKPTIWIELDIEEFEEKPSNTIPGFIDTLLKVIPSLHTHTCSRGYAGGFVERLHEGTWIGHILEHIALEIQHLAGISVKRGKTITSERKGIYFVTYDYAEPKSGFYAFEAALEIVTAILDGRQISADSYITHTSDLYHLHKLGPSTEAIYEAARKRKIPVERIGTNSYLRIGTGKKQKSVQATISSQTSYLAVENSCDKDMTKTLVRGAGLPVPKGDVVSNEYELLQSAENIGYPLVIKPLNGRQGQNIITNIQNDTDLIAAFRCVFSEGTSYILERYYAGNDYRFFVVNKELVAASLRLPPFVIGDGYKTIAELIDEENLNPLRGDGHEKAMSKIPLDERTVVHLEKSGYSLQSVLNKGESLEVLGNANLSTGGSAIDVTDDVHPDYRNMAIEAAEAVGLDIAGIDILSPDVTVPFVEGEAAILEVNAAPGIRMHLHPSQGKKRDAGGAIVDYLFASREEAAVPVVAVTGTNGKTTTTRLVSHLLQKENITVGYTCSDGVWVGDQQLDAGDCSGPRSARKVLAHPSVDIAVLETARGGMLREGLAFRYCDVGIVTNVSEDHLGLNGVETLVDLKKLKQTVAEVVLPEGTCVLNADDSRCVDMANHTNGEVIFFSLSVNNPVIQDQLKQGLKVWYLEDDWVVFNENGKSERFLPVSHIPITINGAARHNIANVLGALAAAHSLGRPLSELRSKVITFLSSENQNRGRFNVLNIHDRTIVVDYAHNPAGLKALFETVDHLKSGRVITVGSAAGDRQDQTIQEMGRIFGTHSDIFIIKEDVNLRGRIPGETVHHLYMGVKEAEGITSVSVYPKEAEALIQAWECSEPGDTLVFLYDEYTSIQGILQKIRNSKAVGVLQKAE